MKISEFKAQLSDLTTLSFVLPNGSPIPQHFHITEAGLLTKHFIDCGGTIRTEKNITLQMWVANDYHHRLEPQKLNKIIDIAQPLLGSDDCEVEIEYQTETIGRYGVHFNGQHFVLMPKHTNCLASDQCGITPPIQKIKKQFLELQTVQDNCCTPGSGCC